MYDDLISRQAAIDAILAVTGNSSVRELYEHVQEHGLSDMWSGGVNAAIDIIIAVPSAQPEPCVDTIDALDESIKHFDDMAEECWRNANIEQNDYMDMRDDAAEYRQLSIWLNELKWLRERFQSQPEHTNSWYINSWCIDCKEYDKEKHSCPRFNRVIKQTLDEIYSHAETEAEARFHNEIVRCKDCKHSRFFDPCFYCYEFGEEINVPENGFCFMAERRTDDLQ